MVDGVSKFASAVVPSRRNLTGAVTGILLCFSLSNGAVAQIAATDSARQVLATIPIQSSSAQRYELSLLPCQDSKCPFEIQWLVNGKVQDAVQLTWPASASGAKAQAVEPVHGVGDPMSHSDSTKVWSVGEEEGTVTISARPVTVSSNVVGLLIDQMAGFDHPKRQHAIYAVIDGKLKAVWSQSELQGPYSSWVAKPTGKPLVYFSVFRSPTDDVSDQITTRSLIWNKAQQIYTEQDGASGLYAVTAGAYRDVHSARSAIKQAGDCLGRYWVLDAGTLKTSPARRFVVTLLTSDRTIAKAEQARLKTCSPAVKTVVSSVPRAFLK